MAGCSVEPDGEHVRVQHGRVLCCTRHDALSYVQTGLFQLRGQSFVTPICISVCPCAISSQVLGSPNFIFCDNVLIYGIG